MLDATYNETVTVRRESARNVKNEITYAEVLDAVGGPLNVRCRIERRKRNIKLAEGTEKAVDATMIFRTDKTVVPIKMHDLLFTKLEETYEVVSIEAVSAMFSGGAYGRAFLSITEQPVVKDQHPAK